MRTTNRRVRVPISHVITVYRHTATKCHSDKLDLRTLDFTLHSNFLSPVQTLSARGGTREIAFSKGPCMLPWLHYHRGWLHEREGGQNKGIKKPLQPVMYNKCTHLQYSLQSTGQRKKQTKIQLSNNHHHNHTCREHQLTNPIAVKHVCRSRQSVRNTAFVAGTPRQPQYPAGAGGKQTHMLQSVS